MEELEPLLPPGLCCGDREVQHNLKVQRWADGSATLTVCDRAVFRAPGWERASDPPRVFSSAVADEIAEDEYREAERAGKFLSDGQALPSDIENVRRAVRRARAKVTGLARSNAFAYFVTLTLSDERVDRHDDAAVLKKFQNWLHNFSRRYGLAYVLVPERHKDGAIHFHGFINEVLWAKDSGTVIPADGGRPRRPRSDAERRRLLDAGGHIVYNLPQWSFGFTTAIRLYGEYTSAVRYVCKYIGKSYSPSSGLPEKIGGRWFYSGGPLVRPFPDLADVNFDDFIRLYEGWDFTVKATGDRYRVVEIPVGKEGIL